VHVRNGYTFDQGLNSRDGLAVLGVFYEQSDRIRPEQERQWQLISQNLQQLEKPSEHVCTTANRVSVRAQ